jgi:membrane-associated phospholipid phosphatase
MANIRPMSVNSKIAALQQTESSRAMSRIWVSLNWTDRILAGWYLGLGIALLCSPQNSNSRLHYLPLHVLVPVAIIVLAFLSDRGRWFQFAHDWYPLFLFIAAFEETAKLSLVFIPHWQDAVILRAEAAIFSRPPSLWLNQRHGILLTEVLEFGYFTFYWIMPVVGGVLYPNIWNASASRIAKDREQPFRLWMDATVVGYLVCYITYLLFPTEGPAHTLAPQFSRSMTAGPFHFLVLLIQRHGGVHGNAFPSGHIMASVVALLAASRWKPRLGRWLSIPVLLMGVGAVYDGYHYASDIVAGAAVGVVAFYVVIAIRRANRAAVA